MYCHIIDRYDQLTWHKSQGDKTYFLLRIVISIMVASTDLIDESPVNPSVFNPFWAFFSLLFVAIRHCGMTMSRKMFYRSLMSAMAKKCWERLRKHQITAAELRASRTSLGFSWRQPCRQLRMPLLLVFDANVATLPIFLWSSVTSW